MVLFKRLIEIFCFFALIEICIWYIGPRHPLLREMCIVNLAIAMMMSSIGHEDTPEALGFKPTKNGAWHIVALGVMLNLSMLAMLCMAYNKTGIGSFEDFALRALFYLPWALAQQFAANSFFTNRLYAVFGKGRERATSVLSGALFAVVHLPNPVLFLFAFINGALGARIFLSHKNLCALVVAHAILAPAVELFLPESWHKGLAIGPGFLMK